jgi:hypothetical protein
MGITLSAGCIYTLPTALSDSRAGSIIIAEQQVKESGTGRTADKAV